MKVAAGVNRGRQFLQHPGPTNIPERIFRAMSRAVIDYNTDEFQNLFTEAQDGLRRIFKTEGAVITYTASGHGAWEAALVNVLSPGDTIAVVDSGFFSAKWAGFAESLGFKTVVLPCDRRQGLDPATLEAHLAADKNHTIKAVVLVHNETSTGLAADCGAMRMAIDRAEHPALYLIDSISSLACFDVSMDDWKADVIVAGSQKGLMMPVGLSFTGVSKKAMAASERSRSPRAYWDWRRLMTGMRQTSFHGTQPVNLVFGLHEAIKMIEEEGLDRVFFRHRRVAEAVRAAVTVWQQNGGPELFVRHPRRLSDTVATLLMPDGYDADDLRRVCLERFNVALAPGLGELKGKVFRIGHIGDLSEAMVLGTIAATEIALNLCGVPHTEGGVQAAMQHFTTTRDLDGSPFVSKENLTLINAGAVGQRAEIAANGRS